MTIQHRLIPDAELHEPKGVSTATSQQVYHADGLGSGVWKRPDGLSIKGLTGDGGSTNKNIISDGTDGFTYRMHKAYGGMGITNNAANFAMTAAVDPGLNTDSDYVLLTGGGAPWISSVTSLEIPFSVDRLTVPVNGVYFIDLWCNISLFPNINAKVSFKYRVNGTTFGPRKTVVKSNAAGDYGTLVGSGFITLAAGNYVQVMAASTHTGNLVIGDANGSLLLFHAL